MSYDNRIFNVNGSGEAGLLVAMTLAFDQKGFAARACNSTASGLVFYWSVAEGTKALPESADGFTAEQCLPFVLSWLESDYAKAVPCEGWDADYDHEGFNSVGWRVFCGDWGHVDQNPYAICAVKRVYLWHGK